MAFYTHEYKVNLNDIGAGNLLTNHALLSYLEDIAAMHSEEVGFGVNNMNETGLTWVLLQWKLSILKRIPFGSLFTIRTWARYTKKFYSYRDFEVLDASGNIIAVATSKWTLVNISKNSLEKITDEMISLYNPENKNVFGELELEKLVLPTQLEPTYHFTIPRTYIDVNGHVHNLNYLTLAYEALPNEVYEKGEYSHVEILFKKEMKLNDMITCSYVFSNNTHYIGIHSQDGNTLHAIVKLY